MKTFAIMLNLVGRLAVVVGGGSVGMRKLRSLLECGPNVRLIEPAGAAQLDPRVDLIPEPYRREHLAGAAIVFACTNDQRLNRQIACDARQIGALVNAADQPEDCDFFLPATACSGDVMLAVGTGGQCPSLSASLRDELAVNLDASIGQYASLLGQIRLELRAANLPPQQQRQILRRLSARESRELYASLGQAAVRELLTSLLQQRV